MAQAKLKPIGSLRRFSNPEPRYRERSEVRANLSGPGKTKKWLVPLFSTMIQAGGASQP